MSADIVMGLVLAAAFLAGALMLVFGTVARRNRRRSGAPAGPEAALLAGHVVAADAGGHCSPSDGGSAGCDGGGGS